MTTKIRSQSWNLEQEDIEMKSTLSELWTRMSQGKEKVENGARMSHEEENVEKGAKMSREEEKVKMEKTKAAKKGEE